MTETSEQAITKTEDSVIPFHSEYKNVMQLHRQMQEEIELRKLLTEFIKYNMVEGTDYGKIHISSKCENKYTPKQCKIAGHWSKPCLFKPGAEKFCSLFKYRVEYKKDQETWEMLGSRSGIIAFICFIKDQKHNIVGEGRGIANVQDKGDNTGVKIAEKRAKIDAVLSTGGLSDFFTQDLEDTKPSEREEQEFHQTSPDRARSISTKVMMTNTSRQEIIRLCKLKGYDLAALTRYAKKAYGVVSYDNLTELNAKQVIIKLNSIAPKAVKKQESPVEGISIEEAAQRIGKALNAATISIENKEVDQLAKEVL